MMGPVLAIYRKDIKAFLTNPMFYLLTGLCCCLWALFFGFEVYAYIQKSYQLSMKDSSTGLNIHQHLVSTFLVIVHYVLVFIIAAFSIRYFAEEKKLRTFPILLASPITSWQIVLAKWLVGGSVILALLLVSAVFPLSLLFFSPLPLGLFLFSYLGVFLVLCVYMSASLFASAMTESMIVCVVLSLVFNILLLMLGVGREFSDMGWVQDIFNFLSFDSHFANFRKGIFNLSSLVYFLSWSLFLALGTERVIESHRWR